MHPEFKMITTMSVKNSIFIDEVFQIEVSDGIPTSTTKENKTFKRPQSYGYLALKMVYCALYPHFKFPSTFNLIMKKAQAKYSIASGLVT